MAKVYAIPRGPIVNDRGELSPEWRTYLQRLGATLNAVAAVTALDGVTTYTADQLRDKLIELQTAFGADI